MSTRDNAPDFNGRPGGVSGAGQAALLPRDLTEWVGSFVLVRLTLEALDELMPAPTKPTFSTSSGTCHAPMLLTLVTYAYAKGMTGSRDIELAIPNDKVLKYICAGERPDWNMLRLYRRQHKKLIQDCLAAVLTRAWENRFPAPAQTPGDGAHSYAGISLDRWAVPSRPDVQAEAARRVRLAILADTLLSDE